MAAIALLLIVWLLGLLVRAATIATLGANTFVVFAVPQSRAAQSRSPVVGYAFGCAFGAGLSYLSGRVSAWLVGLAEFVPIVVGAIAVGLAMFLMIITDSEHPPAAGLALGLVLRPWASGDLAPVMLAVTMLAALGRLLRGVLVDLN